MRTLPTPTPESKLATESCLISIDERRLARRAFVRRVRLARERRETTVTLPMAVAQALRAVIVTTLGDVPAERDAQERAS